MSKYPKRQAAFKCQPVENCEPRKRRRYEVYNGQEMLGSFVLNERTGVALAWDSERRFIGRSAGFKEAAAAISRAYRSKASAAEARQRLSEPVPFASGLSARFLGHQR
jgi:hypothetical protein